MSLISNKSRNLKNYLQPLSHSNVVRKRKGGGTLIQNPAAFSTDSEYIFLNSGWGVKVFNIKTGECVLVLETENLGYGRVLSVLPKDGPVIVITVDSSDQLYCLFWAPKVSLIQRKTKLTLPPKYQSSAVVDALLVPSISDRSSQDLCLVVRVKLDAYSVLFYNPESTDYLKNHPLNGTGVGYSDKKRALSFGGPPDMRIMATIVKGFGLDVYSLDGSKKMLKQRAGSNISWTSVCCHPMEPCVAVGDSLGRCVLFRDPLFKPNVKTIFHWHTLPCDVIAFTPAGSTMYTGGSEHVLVKWNVENPNVKNFLPRLPAPIVHISVSPDNSLIAVSTLDNSIILVESSHRVQRVLQHLAWGVLSHPDCVLFPAGLLFDPISRSVVLNSRPGHLQFYCPDSEILKSVDICQQNILTQERQKVIINVDVTKVALTSDSAWMATIETRHEQNVSVELRLKLWQFQVPDKKWILNSVVEMPHMGLVGCLRFRPISTTSKDSSTDYLLVTTGDDNKFRLWSPSPIDSVYKQGVIWNCESSASYKDKSAGPACFSEDGSLLAVAFQHIITLWSTDGLKFRFSLSRFLPLIEQIEFGRDSCCHLLVATTKTDVSVWNLLTLSVLWTAKVNPLMLISDPCSSFMALFSTKNKLFIFKPMSSDFVHVEKKLCDSKVNICGAAFAPRDVANVLAPSWLVKSLLYYIDSNQELHSFESESSLVSGTDMVELIQDVEKPTLFHDLKKAQLSSVMKKKESIHPSRHQYGIVGAAVVKEFLRAPCHTMPPVSTLCTSLLEALALSKISVKEKEKSNKMDIDPDEENTDEGIYDDSDSETEITKKSNMIIEAGNIDKIKMNFQNNINPDLKQKTDDLFFIDLDDEVDNVLNN